VCLCTHCSACSVEGDWASEKAKHARGVAGLIGQVCWQPEVRFKFWVLQIAPPGRASVATSNLKWPGSSQLQGVTMTLAEQRPSPKPRRRAGPGSEDPAEGRPSPAPRWQPSRLRGWRCLAGHRDRPAHATEWPRRRGLSASRGPHLRGGACDKAAAGIVPGHSGCSLLAGPLLQVYRRRHGLLSCH